MVEARRREIPGRNESELIEPRYVSSKSRPRPFQCAEGGTGCNDNDKRQVTACLTGVEEDGMGLKVLYELGRASGWQENSTSLKEARRGNKAAGSRTDP